MDNARYEDLEKEITELSERAPNAIESVTLLQKLTSLPESHTAPEMFPEPECHWEKNEKSLYLTHAPFISLREIHSGP